MLVSTRPSMGFPLVLICGNSSSSVVLCFITLCAIYILYNPSLSEYALSDDSQAVEKKIAKKNVALILNHAEY